MVISELFYSTFQVPLYTLEVGDYFSVDYPVKIYSEVIQKTTECSDTCDRYTGIKYAYILSPKCLITKIDYSKIY